MTTHILLERQFKKYAEQVDLIATHEFNRLVKPYLIKHGYSFFVGMGTYLILNGSIQIDSDDLPKTIQDILNTEIPGMPGNSLGSLMPEYDHKKER